MKEAYFNNVNVDYNNLNQAKITEINDKLNNIKNNLPNLFNCINSIVKDAVSIHGSITIKFFSESDINYTAFGASWCKSKKIINIDSNLNYFDLIDSIIVELQNACNESLNTISDDQLSEAYMPDLSEEKIKKMALEIEKAEYPSRTKTQQVKYEYLLNNEAEITPFLQQHGENYQELLKETEESLQYSFDNYIKQKTTLIHTRRYEDTIRHNNEIKGIIDKEKQKLEEHRQWLLEFEKERHENKIKMDFLMQKSNIGKSFRSLLEEKYNLIYDINHEKVENNSYSHDVINKHNLDSKDLEGSLDKVNFAIYDAAYNHIHSLVISLIPEQFNEQEIIGKMQSYVDSIEFISL